MAVFPLPATFKCKGAKPLKPVCFFLSLLAVSLITTCAAGAQATRTWVSGVGDDANPCSRTAPCKTFAGAISKTAAGGEIDNLDEGGFGALTITKAITIDGGGGQVASVLVAGTNGITVSAGTSDVVTLRNISFQGLAGVGLNGIQLNSAGTLHIEHCAIFGFSGSGIAITPTSQPASGAQVFIEDTVSQDNVGNGLHVLASSTNIRVSVSNSRFTGNGQAGINAADYSRVSIWNSNINGNSAGLLANAATGTTVISIADSMVTNNPGNGAQAGGGAGSSAIRLQNVSLFSNGTGFSEGTNGTIASFGNNYNTNSGAPDATLTPQ
jgi:hypothetical protein